MKFKIGLSLFMLFGFFFFRIIGPVIAKFLKSMHERNNTGLVEKAPRIFKFINIFLIIASTMCLFYIVLIWTGFVQIPNE